MAIIHFLSVYSTSKNYILQLDINLIADQFAFLHKLQVLYFLLCINYRMSVCPCQPSFKIFDYRINPIKFTSGTAFHERQELKVKGIITITQRYFS